MRKPQPANAEQERKAIAQQDLQAFCDLVVTRAAEVMNEKSAPIEMILDRMITYATAQAMASFGRDDALKLLRLAINGIEGGALDHLQPKPIN